MAEEQTVALCCAMADLIGALQARRQNDMYAHNWSAHADSIDELAAAFPDLAEYFENELESLEDE